MTEKTCPMTSKETCHMALLLHEECVRGSIEHGKFSMLKFKDTSHRLMHLMQEVHLHWGKLGM